MAQPQSLLISLAAAALLTGACSSVESPAQPETSGGATASLTPAWIQTHGAATAENASMTTGSPQEGTSPASFTAETGDHAPSASAWTSEAFDRLGQIETTTGSLATEVRALSRQVGTLTANDAASLNQAEAANELITNLSGRFEQLNDSVGALQNTISALATAVNANGKAIGEVRTDVRNVSTSVSGSITPAVELGLGTTGGWFKTTLFAVVVGFAALGFFFWRATRRTGGAFENAR